MMGKPIYITGTGIVSAIGNDKQHTLQSLLRSESGIAPIRYLNTEHNEFPVGEVKLSNSEMRAILGIDEQKPLTRTSLLGAIAIKQAIKEALLDDRQLNSAGLISGTTVGGMDTTELYYHDIISDNSKNSYINIHDCGATTELSADMVGRFAFVTTLSTACSSAANAIIAAADMIRSGEADIVIAGGAECLTKYHLNGFNTLMILDKEPCRPFDANRAGLNLGEGAAYVVLESAESVNRRSITPLAILKGYANACDAYHQTASSACGDGAYLAMKNALSDGETRVSDIDYINAHGTGTPNNDESETAAMKRLFGDNMPEVSSTKSSTGHTTSASGAIETVICVLAINNNFTPVNVNWKNRMENGIIPVQDIKPIKPIKNVLCNSFAFGGNDSSLLISKYN
jgi:3-oxoacyl-[acyl-carrier-protein] synthase II